MDKRIGGLMGYASLRFPVIHSSKNPTIPFCVSVVAGTRGLNQKPTTVASRGFLLNRYVQQAPTAASATTTTRLTACLMFFNITVVV
jgi:hypothetical protein